MAVTNANRITREAPSSPTVRRFMESQSLPARARRERLRGANDIKTGEASSTAANDNETLFEETHITASGQPQQNQKASLLEKQVRLRVGLVLCTIFSGAQSTFALMAAGTIPILPMALILWLISALCAFAGFISIRIVLKVPVFEHVSLAIATVCFFILSLIPFLNILPWMVAWTWMLHFSTDENSAV